MPEEPILVVWCEMCEASLCNDTEFESDEQAAAVADTMGWLEMDGFWYCKSCRPRHRRFRLAWDVLDLCEVLPPEVYHEYDTLIDPVLSHYCSPENS